MKTIILLIFSFLCAYNSEAQKMYIWCPNELNPSINTELLQGVEVNIIINDSRLLTSKVKNKCTSDELTKSVFDLIEDSYPNAKIKEVKSKKEKTKDCAILIEVKITAYYATFTSPMWYAQTDFSVAIYDYRSEELNEYSKDIHKEKKFFNAGGFATAKNNLNKTYIEANIELLDFIADNIN